MVIEVSLQNHVSKEGHSGCKNYTSVLLDSLVPNRMTLFGPLPRGLYSTSSLESPESKILKIRLETNPRFDAQIWIGEGTLLAKTE